MADKFYEKIVALREEMYVQAVEDARDEGGEEAALAVESEYNAHSIDEVTNKILTILYDSIGA